MKRVSRFLPLLALLALVACAPVRVRQDDASLRVQLEREMQFKKISKWILEARFAVSDGRGGGNASLHWRQDGERFDLTVRTPVTGRAWRLYGKGRELTLEGAAAEPLRGVEAETVLARELGWEAPLTELMYWVRGLRAPDAEADLSFDALGRPATLRQSGWQIEYRDWFADRDLWLPRKVFATRGKARVRLFVEEWSVEARQAP